MNGELSSSKVMVRTIDHWVGFLKVENSTTYKIWKFTTLQICKCFKENYWLKKIIDFKENYWKYIQNYQLSNTLNGLEKKNV
jgi:hypothetical protein